MPMRLAVLGFLSLLLAFGLITTSATANVVCSFTISDVDFGNVDLLTGTQFTTAGTLTANCTGANTDGATIIICANLGSGSGGSSSGNPRYLLNGGNQLQYNLYKDAGYSNVWGSLDWGHSPTPLDWLATADGSGNLNASTQIYAKISAGQGALPTGSYSSLFTGFSHVDIRYKEAVSTCAIIHDSAEENVTTSFSVSANNVPSCTVSATDLDFGTMGVISTNVDATNTISLKCNNSLPYDIGLDGGLSGAADPTQRKMSFGAAEVTYGLYRDAGRSLAWGDTIGSNTQSGTGTGSAQAYTVYGRVPAQITPAPATYTDTIVVTITY